ncbi:MAG: thymidine phosphorylase [Erysipelothrix sp.]|nr:thymidine phosphorylase [Erysipelothrix sp.]
MRFVDIIEKKKNGESLSTEEINFWIDGLMDKSVKDYQTTALLMAIVLKGMDTRETSDLTMAMLNSGSIIDLSSIEGIKVDKHSTGGVGDKSTMVLSPMAAANHAKVAKMSGRGLGHTGGTLDKLESIPGYNVFLTREQFIDQVNNIGIALLGQTGESVPADKTIYALRDVTATVDAMPLIAASIMSKKLASGSDTILLDVKYGDGAFMETKEKAIELATIMINIGEHLNKNVRAMITNMNEPLGNAIGNSLEIIESIETLKGKGPADLYELCSESAAIMLTQAGLSENVEEGLKQIAQSIEDGSALNKLRELIDAQGGDSRVVDDYSVFTPAKYVTTLKSPQSGYIKTIHASNLGKLAMELGAGRATAEDSINFAVGLVLDGKISDYRSTQDNLITVYHDAPLTDNWLNKLYNSYEFDLNPVEKAPIIHTVL